eukprot:GEZU01029230.1.p1 GENE.GEZU01029230.1~~GEZU01029230.1.p1  ORF type:complete len:137 (+),score=21.75 GEZU01029230.1:42-452(+)
MPLSHLVDKAMSFYLGRQTRVISRELLKPGKFDPVAIFGGEHFWTKYTTTPHEDLALWEKIDKWLTLKYRSSLRYERVGRCCINKLQWEIFRMWASTSQSVHHNADAILCQTTHMMIINLLSHNNICHIQVCSILQ